MRVQVRLGTTKAEEKAKQEEQKRYSSGPQSFLPLTAGTIRG